MSYNISSAAGNHNGITIETFKTPKGEIVKREAHYIALNMTMDKLPKFDFKAYNKKKNGKIDLWKFNKQGIDCEVGDYYEVEYDVWSYPDNWSNSLIKKFETALKKADFYNNVTDALQFELVNFELIFYGPLLIEKQ